MTNYRPYYTSDDSCSSEDELNYSHKFYDAKREMQNSSEFGNSLYPLERIEREKTQQKNSDNSEFSNKDKSRTFISNDNNGECFFLDDIRTAVTKGNLSFITEYINLNEKFFIDTILRSGWTMLMYACERGYPQIVFFCLEKKADPNFHKDSLTPLMISCGSQYSEEADLLLCVQHLLKFGANVNSKDSSGMTPLMYACDNNRIEIVKELLKNASDLNAQDKRGWTAIHCAAFKGFGELIRLLIDEGAELNITSKDGLTPADVAYESNFNLIGRLLDRIRKQSTIKLSNEDIDCLQESVKVEINLPKIKSFSFIEELKVFLTNLNLDHYYDLFQSHKLNLRDVLLFNEEDLDNIGIKIYADKLKILEGIKSAHILNWKFSSLPLIRQKTLISCPDIDCVLKNIAKHLGYIETTIQYFHKKAKDDDELLKRGKDFVNISALIEDTKEVSSNCKSLSKTIETFLNLLNKMEKPWLLPVNEIKEEEEKEKMKCYSKFPKSVVLIGIGSLTLLLLKMIR